MWHEKGRFALNIVNLFPTSGKGGRILEAGGLISKNIHIHTLKHLIFSVF